MGHDLYGHGKTNFKKGHWPNYDAVMDSIAALIEEAQKSFPGKAVFLYGHSMGGNLAANYALRRKPNIKGLILSAPWFRLAFKPSSTDLFLAKMMLNIYPSFTQSSKLDANAISRDPAEVEKYKNDPLVHDLVSPQMFTSTHQAAQWALDHAADLSLPLLHMHGDADELTSFEASKEFFCQSRWRRCYFSGLSRLLFTKCTMNPKRNRKPVLNLLRDWIQERI